MIAWTPHDKDSKGNKYREPYYATWGTYSLAKGFIRGRARYVLYEGKKLLRAFDSSQEASEWLTRQKQK